MAELLGSVIYVIFGCVVGAGGDNPVHLRHLTKEVDCYKMVNAWSSGTGMAELLGSVIYVIFGCVVGAGGDNQVRLRHLTK